MLRGLGAIIIDADMLAREVVEPGRPALEAIRRVFGAAVLLPSGALDRRKLAGIVFSDKAKLGQLEAITHPAVRIELDRYIDQASNDAIVVIEVIRLFEGGYAQRCDQVWVTDCPRPMQISRLMTGRAMTEVEAIQRVDAQPAQAEKVARADVVIDTSHSLADTRRQVETALHRLSTDGF